ncbi:MULTISPECIES: hypothetical protein [Acinetobacter]|uniref:Uncharacterized protein n=1 Tax=Acinetobacter baylyi (strain ATCC 33305 / BD413 / ADP1) TaxID=62977 RepID=Q6FDP3_ACIAD|nr:MULTISPECIES: hypothetical protein [Acinetobacter]ENV55597.1 hypothetical protein F952_00219 [Acinetobacter baylyi DSM 14961 = CIP 107474]KAF2369588.1 hypothetical protein BSL88_14960 [Acinetobacter baylyi]KAF2373634.1 hypothetical protein BSL67_11840 [Acinetobacter baylyi]KAF2376506.1 hypothetical protein BSN81_12915 [Acinetobacter baylyi]KAF2379368.1 hypothetical protein BSN83_15735 [Acinetobacter baylyi]
MSIKINFLSVLCLPLLTACVGNMNPTGGNSSPNYPFFITTQAQIVKNIRVPIGTKLVYQEQSFKQGRQDRLLPETKLTAIEFPNNQTILWGGVPISSINKFFNSEMHGYTVYADFKRLPDTQKNRFTQLWQSCDERLGITVKNTNDWSFNKNNITDVESCSVLYQRYFKNDAKQQNFLDQLHQALNRVD